MSLANKPTTQSLEFKKSTGGTHVYQCPSDGRSTAAVTDIYIKKSAFLGEPPPKLRLTIEEI